MKESTEVMVSVDGTKIWARWFEDGNPGGYTARDTALLKKVVGILSEALEQANGQLSIYSRKDG